MKELVIIGAGGLGREVLQLVLDINRGAPRWRLRGFLDEDLEAAGQTCLGYPVAGGLDRLEPASAAAGLYAVCAVGSPGAREDLVSRARAAGFSFGTLVHPRALISDFAEVGEGAIVFAGSIVEPGAAVGRHVLINKSCTVGHDTVIGDFSTVAPGANIGGNVRIGRGCDIGMNAAVIQGLVIGDGAVLGAGAAAVRDIPGHCTAVGVPARPIKHRGQPSG